MKIVNVNKKIFMGILVVAFFCFAITITILLLNRNKYGVTKIDNTSLILIKEKISSDNFKKGDLVFVEGKKINEINEGDEVFAYHLNKDGVVNIEVGTVDKIHPSNEGDSAISFKNGATYAMEFVVGTSDKVYSKVGTYLGIIESTWGFLFIILVPSLLIFIYEIYALVVEIKYGKEETQN